MLILGQHVLQVDCWKVSHLCWLYYVMAAFSTWRGWYSGTACSYICLLFHLY